MYEKSEWLFGLHNLFKTKDGLTSEQSYRRIIDNIDELDVCFSDRLTPKETYDDFWE